MTEKDRKSGQAVHIRQILGDVLKSCRSDVGSEMIDVWRIWDRAVGDVIAENTRPAAFKGRLLLVHAESSVWIHQLTFLKAELIERINSALGRNLVADIKFKVGPVAPPEKRR